jgi:hypothetical protein
MRCPYGGCSSLMAHAAPMWLMWLPYGTIGIKYGTFHLPYGSILLPYIAHCSCTVHTSLMWSHMVLAALIHHMQLSHGAIWLPNGGHGSHMAHKAPLWSPSGAYSSQAVPSTSNLVGHIGLIGLPHITCGSHTFPSVPHMAHPASIMHHLPPVWGT